jgi:manganese/iron transport system substrate-binding protein
MRHQPTPKVTWGSISQIAGLLIGVGFLTSCGGTSVSTSAARTVSPTGYSPTREVKDLIVVATTSVLCGLIQDIAQDTVKTECLVDGGVDPHVYQPTPEDRKTIEQADLIMYGGYNFEPSLIKLVKSTSNPASKIAVHELAVPQPLIMAGDHEHGHKGVEQGESHADEDAQTETENAEDAEPDPHVWHNVQNTIRMIREIEKQLSQLAPSNATVYAQKAEALTQDLEKLDTWVKAQVATIPPASRKLITTHDALGYYAAAYNIPVEGALLGVSTDEKPTASRIKKLVDEIRATGVPTIFAEVAVNPNLLNTVAKDANVNVSERELVTDGLGAPNSETATYKAMMMANTQAIVEGLGGNFTPLN